MRIGIVTQPLKSNYGGILQNWALQQILIQLGHTPITIDVLPRNQRYRSYLIGNVLYVISLLFHIKKRCFLPLYMQRPFLFDKFVKKHIVTTRIVKRRTKGLILQYGIQALLVGSDQVWRPKYNIGCLKDSYLKFAKSIQCIKVAYAASFGTDCWEYSNKQAEECRELLSTFKKLSVREPSGVSLCKKYFDVDVELVLDPTLLLEKTDYLSLIEDTPRLFNEPFFAAYILNMNSVLREEIEQKASEKGLKALIISADSSAELTIEQWLSIFRDADYIITDSFHGSVFSLIFEKQFEYFSNEERGAARFKVIHDLLLYGNYQEMKQKSINFLKDAFGTMDNFV